MAWLSFWRAFHGRRRRRLGLGTGGAIVGLLLVGAAGAAQIPTTGTLRVVWEQDLPPYPSGPAMDVRWAGDNTVYLAWIKEGITETALDGKFSRLRTLVADPLRWMRDFEILATSKEYLVASARFNTLLFRPAKGKPGGTVTISKVPIGIVQDLDLAADRLLLLGNPEWTTSPAPAIAWVGPVSAHPEKDLKALPLTDAGGPQSPGLVNCSELLVGGVRFMPDGTFVVVPGFQPGAYLFSAGGRLLRTWDTEALGMDALDCAHLSAEESRRFGRSPQARFAYLNQHRVLEDILPLAAGPGLLLRSVKDGKVSWELKVLQSGARVSTYAVPVEGELPYDRLRGDARGGRIVFLRGAQGFDKLAPPYRANHVVVAELPHDAGAEGGVP